MKNIIKTVIVMLTSISLFTSANAGELTVSGTAKATYNITSGYANTGKALGVANEFDLGANGELDNGYTWKYQIQMDPGNSTNVSSSSEVENDDSQLTLTTPYGTVGVFISEGGLDLEDGASQSVYGRPTDLGDPSATTDAYDIDGTNNLQYHTPKDLLPFGIAVKVGYAPNAPDANNSANGSGVVNTRATTNKGLTAHGMQVKAEPIDGLVVGASFVETMDSATELTRRGDNNSYAAMITYAIGSFELGASRSHFDPFINSVATPTTTAKYYEQGNYSVAFAVNDNLSLSYELEESEKTFLADAQATVEQTSTALQAAYTMGGMTVALSLGDYENVGYTTSNDAKQTLIAVSMAF